MAWDSPLGGVSELVGACADGVAATQGAFQLSRLVVDAPVELQAWVGADGFVAIGISPPRQAQETSVMPVLHRIRIVVEADQ